MPAPTTYAESTLAPYLALELGDVGCVLGWDEAHAQVRQAVNDTARLLGVVDVADADNAGKVERLGAVAVWRRAWGSLSARYQVSEDQQAFNRQQMFDMVTKKLADVERLAMADLPEYAIRVDTLAYPQDPYAYVPDALRVL